VTDVDVSRHEDIGNQLAVALPPFRLRAHHRSLPLARKCDQPVQRPRKLDRLHVIGVSAERGMPPAAVRRVRFRLSQPAKRTEMEIRDAVRAEEFRQRLR
jgi:hypothetical protein